MSDVPGPRSISSHPLPDGVNCLVAVIGRANRGRSTDRFSKNAEGKDLRRATRKLRGKGKRGFADGSSLPKTANGGGGVAV